MRISLGVRGQGGRDDDDDDDDGVEQASSFDDLCVESVMNRCDKREYSEGREGGREHTKKKKNRLRYLVFCPSLPEADIANSFQAFVDISETAFPKIP